jgi:hypothetical protein
MVILYKALKRQSKIPLGIYYCNFVIFNKLTYIFSKL